jgi:hypothetical protein
MRQSKLSILDCGIGLTLIRMERLCHGDNIRARDRLLF